jgi:apolipoprotein N-acyltransferase
MSAPYFFDSVPIGGARLFILRWVKHLTTFSVLECKCPADGWTHNTHLVFRAIENRVPMIKSDKIFYSAIIDPWGRIITRVVNPLSVAEAKAAAASNSMVPQLLLADIPLGSGESLYVSFGDWFGWLAVLVKAGFLVFSISLRFKGKNS